MQLNSGIDHQEDSTGGPSREEIENLCILHAIGRGGCPVNELTTRLGLSDMLADFIAEGIKPLISNGWIELCDGRFSLTHEGREWLEDGLRH